jgi:hypothetical protein
MDSRFSALQRGIDNVLANWPLLLIRLAEYVALIALILVTVFGGLFPAIFLGVFRSVFERAEAPEDAAMVLIEHPFLILWVLLLFLVVITFAMIVHSFVQAGVVGCYIDGERVAAASRSLLRSRFRVFTPDLWLRHARTKWWPVFLIYNITWGLFLLLLLIPLAAIAFLTFLGRESPGVIFIACGGLIAIFGVLLIGGIVVQLWTTIAIALSVAGRRVSESVRDGWDLLVSNPLPFVAILVVSFVVSFAVFGFIGIGSFSIGLFGVFDMGLFMLPLQIGISLFQNALSVAIEAWFLAAAIAVVLQLRR